MKIIMITGAFPPIKCGVADYSYKLVVNLLKSSEDLEIIVINSSTEKYSNMNFKSIFFNNWSIFNVFKFLSLIKKEDPDLIHIQYPSITYGSQLVLQLLIIFLRTVGYKTIVTIHEFSETHFLRKLAILPFIFFSNSLIFTNLYEKLVVKRLFPWVEKKSSIINIGSNISVNDDGNVAKEKDLVAFFGFIRPKKGLEEYLELAALSYKKNSNYKFLIIGTPREKEFHYYETLRKKTVLIKNIEWKISLSEKEVSEILSRVKFAYLFYPDGVSERRGSFLACIAHRIIVIANKGRQTPEDLNGSVEFATSPLEAFNKLNELSNDEKRCNEILNNAKEYFKKFDWELIARKHIDLYKNLISKRKIN